MHDGGNVNATTQLSLSFEPGLTARFATIEDCVAHVVHTCRLGVDGVAAKLDMAPSELSRRLNAHTAAKEGDVSNRPLRVDDVIRIVEATNDDRPLYWWIEKRLRDPEATRAAAIQQLAVTLPMVQALVEQAGIEIPKARGGRR